MSDRGRTAVVLLCAVALAVVLRLASAGGFWIDEVFSAAVAKAGPATFAERMKGEPHSPWPIYYLLLHGWQRLWPSVEGMKALSILLSVAQVLAMYGLGRSLKGERVGLIVAILAAANPLLAWYGGEIRMYALMLLALTGAMWAAVRAIRTRRVRDGLLFALLASVAVYAHVFAAFPVLVLTVAVVVRGGRRAAVGTLALGVAAAVPAAIVAAGQAKHWLSWKSGVAGDYVSSPMNLVAAAQSFFTGYALPLQGEGLRAGVLLVLAVLALVTVVTVWVRREPGRWLLLAVAIVAVVLPWILMRRTRMYSPRFAIAALPAVLLLLAMGIHGLVARARDVVLVVVIGLGVAGVVGRAERMDWREVNEILVEERSAGESLYFLGGNVVALQEWFGSPFDGEALPAAEWMRAFEGEEDRWTISFGAQGPMDAMNFDNLGFEPIRFGLFGPGRRIVEDDVPWVGHWRKR